MRIWFMAWSFALLSVLPVQAACAADAQAAAPGGRGVWEGAPVAATPRMRGLWEGAPVVTAEPEDKARGAAAWDVARQFGRIFFGRQRIRTPGVAEKTVPFIGKFEPDGQTFSVFLSLDVRARCRLIAPDAAACQLEAPRKSGQAGLQFEVRRQPTP